MSETNPPRRRQKGRLEGTPRPATLEEMALSREASRKYHESAAHQINPDIREATTSLLARHITELDVGERQSFLDELIQQLAPDDLRWLSDVLDQRLEREAA